MEDFQKNDIQIQSISIEEDLMNNSSHFNLLSKDLWRYRNYILPSKGFVA